jgi:hypothetical protein
MEYHGDEHLIFDDECTELDNDYYDEGVEESWH